MILWCICHWRKVELLDCVDCDSIWRFCFKIEKVNAMKYTGTVKKIVNKKYNTQYF